MFDALRRLDDWALNSWWGLLITPIAWINYRMGYHDSQPSPLGGWLRGPGGAIYVRGGREGRPLRKKK
jgi:hypothetical protein